VTPGRILCAAIVLSCFAAGCSTGAGRYAGTLPASRLHEMRRFYVQQAANDDRELHLVIRDELRRRGLEAEAGSLEAPAETDGIVTYTDRWSWDITTFCTQITLYVRDPRTGYITATGWSYRPSIARKTPAGHVRLILAEWFGAEP
jgi:hypothetical protein